MKRYVVRNKPVGATPLQCMEDWRAAQPPAYANVPLTYAGRLDPLASGTLLILIGEECKKKDQYLALDKAYSFSVLLGVSSDSGDVLGLTDTTVPTTLPATKLQIAARQCVGDITLPYPIFSSKTVVGKPLHTWAMEGRLSEITIPTKSSTVYYLRHAGTDTLSATDIHAHVHAKINTILPVTELRKALGNDFRRTDVLAGWDTWLERNLNTTWQIAHFTCIASSGTYMRTLASEIATQCNTRGLAWSIERTTIGTYQTLPFIKTGFWRGRYR